jgi:hypothetical protein
MSHRDLRPCALLGLPDVCETVCAVAGNSRAQHAIKPTIVRSVDMRSSRPASLWRLHWPRAERQPCMCLHQNTGSPGAISASGDNRTTSERAFFAPRISTSDWKPAMLRVDDASDLPANKLGLRVTRDLSARPSSAEWAEVDLDLVGGVARAFEWPDCDDAADPDVDLGEVVIDDRRLFHRPASARI